MDRRNGSPNRQQDVEIVVENADEISSHSSASCKSADIENQNPQ